VLGHNRYWGSTEGGAPSNKRREKGNLEEKVTAKNLDVFGRTVAKQTRSKKDYITSGGKSREEESLGGQEAKKN